MERTEQDGELKLTETRGELYGPDRHMDYDDRSFLERGEQSFDGRGDPHQFRLIISPEDGVELARDVYGGAPSLQYETRKLMEQLSEDLGTRLDWVAVDHFDTAHPHTHVVVRGVTHDGKALNIAGDYIAEGIRGRYEEIITHELGLKCEHEILDDLTRETKLNRVTTLDRAIVPRIDVGSGGSMSFTKRLGKGINPALVIIDLWTSKIRVGHCPQHASSPALMRSSSDVDKASLRKL